MSLVFTKKCRICKQEKSILEYQKNKLTIDGHKHECKDCVAKSSRRYYRKNKEKIKETAKTWNGANKDKLKVYRNKYLEKKTNQLAATSELTQEQLTTTITQEPILEITTETIIGSVIPCETDPNLTLEPPLENTEVVVEPIIEVAPNPTENNT